MSATPSQAPGRVPRILLVLAVAGLLLSIGAGMLVPVYTDKFGWRFLERAGIDGVDGLFSDICGPNTIAVPPPHMWPVRWFGAAANLAFPEPVFVRLAGVACALAWLALLWLLVGRVEQDAARRGWLRTAAFAVLGIGTLPFVLVLSRPEQPLVITTLLVLLATFWRAPAQTSAKGAWLKVAAILVFSIVAQSYHMKGVLYGGVALVAMWACAAGRHTLLPRLAGIGAVGASLGVSAQYWIGRMRCPADAELAAKFAGENAVSALAADKGMLANAGLVLRGLNPFNYIMLPLPRTTPMSNWLPPEQFTFWQTSIVFLLLGAVWTLAMLATGLMLLRHAKTARLKALAEPRFVLALALLGVAAIWGISQLKRNVYEAGHVLPAILLAALLALTIPGVLRKADLARLAKLVPIIVGAALASQAIVLATMVPPLARATQQAGYLDQQPYSLSIGDYTPVREGAEGAMRAAGMDPDATYRRLMVDDLTYPAMMRHRMPLHYLGVMRDWNGSIDDPVAFLVSRGSDGVVMECLNLDARLRAAAKSEAGICAISGKTLRALHATR